MDDFRHAHHFAELRCKAAVARHLLPALTVVCRAVDGGSRLVAHRLAAMSALTEVYNTLQSNGTVLPNAADAVMNRHVAAFWLHYMWLSVCALDRGVL